MTAMGNLARVMMAAILALPVGAMAKPSALAVVGARIYPSPGAAPINDGVVVVQDGKIIKVGKQSKISVPKTARVIDAHGAVLTAGFWNSHVHLTTPDLLDASAQAAILQRGFEAMLTRWGFTTVFDLVLSR
jgi:imidazolonepropionase-like amidohydrolase